MSKNIESYIRYLKTYLNNNKHNFNIDNIEEYLSLPLFQYFENANLDNHSFIVKESDITLKLDPPKDIEIDNFWLNPLIQLDNNLPDSFKNYKNEFVSNNQNTLLRQEMYNKIKYLHKKNKLSNLDNSFFICYGQLSFSNDEESFNYPLILQNITIEQHEETSFLIEFIGSPIINFEAIREIPNISIKSLSIIKELSSNLNDTITQKSQLDYLLLQLFEAFKYTSSKNLNVLRSTDLALVEKYNQTDVFINHTLRTDLKSDNLLNKIFDKSIKTNNNSDFSNIDFFVNSTNKLKSLINNDLSIINKPYNSNINSFILSILASIENNKNIAYVSSASSHVKALKNKCMENKHLFNNTTTSSTLDNLEDLNHKIERLESNIKADIESFIKTASYTKNEANPVHKINASYEDFWQKDLQNNEDEIIDIAEQVNQVVIEEFYRFPWTRKVAEKCKNKKQFEKWNLLLANIDKYFEYRNKRSSFSDKSIEFKLECKQYSLNVLDEIIAYLEKNSKIPSFGIGVKTSWREFLRTILIDGKIPQTREDFLNIESKLNLYLTKETIIRLWNDLLVDTGFASLEEEADLFEKKISIYYQPIKNSALWYRYVWEPFAQNLVSSGFLWQRFLTEFMNYYVENGLVAMLINGGVKELSRLINYKVKSIESNSLQLENIQDIKEFELFSLNNYRSSIQKLNFSDEELLYELCINNSSNISFFSIDEFLSEVIENNTYFDVLIIDDAETLSMQDLLVLAYCEKAFVLGDLNFNLTNNKNKLDNYEKIFNALLPDLDCKYFSGKHSFINIIYDFVNNKCSNINYVNTNNPKINALRNSLNETSSILSNTNLSFPLYAFNINLEEFDLAAFYETILNSLNAKVNDKTIQIYMNSKSKSIIEKLKSFVINDFYNKNNNDMLISENIIHSKNFLCDYLIVLDFNDENRLTLEDLYTLVSNTKSQLVYITSEINSPVVSFINDVSNKEIENHSNIKDTLYNKNIFALEKVYFKSERLSLITFNETPTIFISTGAIQKTTVCKLIPLSLLYNVLIFNKGDYLSLKNYISSLDENSLEDLLSDLTALYVDLPNRQLREISDVSLSPQVDEEEEIDEDSTGEDPFSRSYIVMDNKKEQTSSIKPESGFNIEVEDLSSISDNIIKAEKAIDLDSSVIEEEFLPTSKFSKSLTIDQGEQNLVSEDQSITNLLSYLDDNKMPFYDYRSNGGDLWIVDTPRVRQRLDAIKDFGVDLSLCLRCEKLPNEINAWKVI